MRPHQGLWGYRMFEEKITGIWDTEGKNYRDTGYLKKKYGDIQCELRGCETAQLRGYGIFQVKVKGMRDTQPPPDEASIGQVSVHTFQKLFMPLLSSVFFIFLWFILFLSICVHSGIICIK